MVLDSEVKTIIKGIVFSEDEKRTLKALNLMLEKTCDHTEHCSECWIWTMYDHADSEHCKAVREFLDNLTTEEN